MEKQDTTETTVQPVEEIWQHILINGSTKLEVSNPMSPKGRLEDLDKIRPFNPIDSEGKTIKPTVVLAEKENENFTKRSSRSHSKTF